jgi:hypothetical protein
MEFFFNGIGQCGHGATPFFKFLLRELHVEPTCTWIKSDGSDEPIQAVVISFLGRSVKWNRLLHHAHFIRSWQNKNFIMGQ